MYWFDRCVYSSENMPNLVHFIQLEYFVRSSRTWFEACKFFNTFCLFIGDRTLLAYLIDVNMFKYVLFALI